MLEPLISAANGIALQPLGVLFFFFKVRGDQKQKSMGLSLAADNLVGWCES